MRTGMYAGLELRLLFAGTVNVGPVKSWMTRLEALTEHAPAGAPDAAVTPETVAVRFVTVIASSFGFVMVRNSFEAAVGNRPLRLPAMVKGCPSALPVPVPVPPV